MQTEQSPKTQDLPTRERGLRRWIRIRRNFLVFSVLAFGIPFWLLSVRFLLRGDQIGDPAFWLILLVAGLAVGFCWGLAVWPVFERTLKQPGAKK